MKYADMTWGRMEAIINKLGGEEGVERFLRGDLVISPAVIPEALPREWREEDSIIYFDVTSDGKTGEQWIVHLGPKGRGLSGYAESVLRSKGFKPTSGITYRVAVLKGTLFENSDRVTSKIRSDAKRRKFETPNAEVACLIRDKFSDEDIEAMGLWWIITMHDPIEDSDGSLSLLGACCSVHSCSLNAFGGGDGARWIDFYGFAFVLSQG